MYTNSYNCYPTGLDGCPTSTQHCTVGGAQGIIPPSLSAGCPTSPQRCKNDQGNAQTMTNPTFGYVCPTTPPSVTPDCLLPTYNGGHTGAQAQTMPPTLGYTCPPAPSSTPACLPPTHQGGYAGAQAQTMPNPTFSGCQPPLSATPYCLPPSYQPECENKTGAQEQAVYPSLGFRCPTSPQRCENYQGNAQTMPNPTFSGCQPPLSATPYCLPPTNKAGTVRPTILGPECPTGEFTCNAPAPYTYQGTQTVHICPTFHCKADGTQAQTMPSIECLVSNTPYCLPPTNQPSCEKNASTGSGSPEQAAGAQAFSVPPNCPTVDTCYPTGMLGCPTDVACPPSATPACLPPTGSHQTHQGQQNVVTMHTCPPTYPPICERTRIGHTCATPQAQAFSVPPNCPTVDTCYPTGMLGCPTDVACPPSATPACLPPANQGGGNANVQTMPNPTFSGCLLSSTPACYPPTYQAYCGGNAQTHITPLPTLPNHCLLSATPACLPPTNQGGSNAGAQAFKPTSQCRTVGCFNQAVTGPATGWACIWDD